LARKSWKKQQGDTRWGMPRCVNKTKGKKMRQDPNAAISKGNQRRVGAPKTKKILGG